MKIHIDNHSRLDIADAAQIVTDLLRREREFMLANTVGVSAELLDRIASLLGLDAHRLLAANGQIAPRLERALLRRPDAWDEIERGLA